MRRTRIGISLAGAAFLAVVGLGSTSAGAPGSADAPADPGAPNSIEQRLKALEESNTRLREELDKLRDEHTSLGDQVQSLLPLSGRFSGYLDFGFFAVQGDGSGIRPDTGHEHFPEYARVSDAWVFMGDPLSTAINARGEPASTGPSRAVAFDAINNGGAPTFLINALNFNIFAAVGEWLTLSGSVDFVPRGRDVSDASGLFVGDFIDIKLGYIEYQAPIDAFKISLYAGKFDSVLGYEYRSQDAPDRLAVTPSLMCRYTCGRPLGLKARAQFFDQDQLTINLAVTNGSNTTEGFPFYNEIDFNKFKTVSARVSSRAPVGAGLEVGASSSFGAQDLQADDSVYHWHYGVDAHLDWNDIELTIELMGGKAEGKSRPGDPPCGVAPCLRYRGGYGQVGYRLFNWLTPYARVDVRDALHQSGASFVYVSQLLRVTGGLRSEIGTNLVLKAEYTANRELGRAPAIPNDVFASSLVIKY